MENSLFRIKPEMRKEYQLIQASGDLDVLARKLLMAEVQQHLGEAALVIDVSQAGFIDASIIGALFEIAGRARDLSHPLAVVDAQSPPRSLWHITGFASVCPVFRSLGEADASLRE